ncbi:MAG: TonB-dependent receptor [Bacteroidales bacterium]
MYTMILVNGMPVKPSVVNGMPIMAQLPVRQAERIEVVYGPAAAVYGADAVSGVINIITREADKGTFAAADISLGQNDYRSFDFMVGGKAGRNKNILQYSFYGGKTAFNDMNIKSGYEEIYNPLNYPQQTGQLYDVDGEIYQPLRITEELLLENGIGPAAFIAGNYPVNYEGDLTMPLIEALPSESNMLGFDIRFRDFSLSFSNMYRRAHSSIGQSTYLFKYNNPQNYWGENIRRTTLSYNHAWTPRVITSTNYSTLSYRMDNNSSQAPTFVPGYNKLYRYSAGDDLLFEQLVTLIPVNGLEIVTGITLQYSGNLPQTSFLVAPFDPKDYTSFSKTVDYRDPISGNFGLNPVTFHNTSFFSQAYYSIKKVRVMGGIRVDNNSLYNSSVSPRIAAIFIPTRKTSFRASLGFAFKAPPTSLTYQSLAYRTGTTPDSLVYLMIPNRELAPEKYMSVELGLIRKRSSNTRFDLSVYYNEIRNLILDQNLPVSDINLPLSVSLTDTSTVLLKQNSRNAVARLYGMQATFRWDDLVKSINMDAELSLTFAKSDESFPDIFAIAGNFISDFTLTPNHFGQLQVSMEPVKNLYLNVSGIWESNWLRVLIPFSDLYEELFKKADGYYTMDLLARYRFSSDLSIFLQVNNLFDEKYGGIGVSRLNAGLPYNPQLGRNIRFGLSYAWN